jgi:polyisoprenoid-binding protein YceI
MSDVTAQDRLAGTWNLAAVHSTANFSVDYLVASFRGSFRTLSAELVDEELRGVVDVRSIDVKDENLAGHLMGPDFFDAEQYPRIGFESSSLQFDGDRVEIDGELTIKGTTRELHATGTVAGPTGDFQGSTRLGFSFATSIDRTAFGVDWNAELPSGGNALGDQVELTVELEFIRAS